ncbi:hypothetical protein P4K49_29565 [Bacillus cereus]|uniref:hypothetical protein n=1 Tax=Bacillati TaxID=1783272 RepID=UPI000676D2CC|nr:MULTISPECIES: hypothetical protein [Bacillaceae]MEB8879740.1 hypothetical protein [Bacillus cereus]AKR38553.1 Hypothetical protein NF53_p2061 [Bacillus thuringiensis serovar indiana]MBG9642311.1 hypothetical protein [Bacillus thuringiensis]MBG9642370.1 hypothetical protein [Bacillus thuringiensis]MBG9649146.1 hypothetical protein [Bacillus thuringiensis]
MKNIFKFAVKYFTEVIVFIYFILVKLAPLHSYALWFHPKEFVAYTTSINNFVAGNIGTVFELLMFAVNIILIAKLYKSQKKDGDADKSEPKTRSERHQRSVK